MKYRKKPVEVEAVQYQFPNIGPVMDFMKGSERLVYDIKTNSYYIDTLEGAMHISDGDYIIKGVHGEFYPCKPDIFNKTYEEVIHEQTKEKKA
ncbi:hypothetical protein [Streptococcus sp. 19428wC2_LYSM12]|uniref:hypothetical protein n=1 Tax=Streptococcus sp. 19428wC2_LYSM12 TaxID=2782470 RepID=UPI0026099522|nr:hypothetical protein [Streptococcus sp. 19428wC2_LYSM12]